MSWFMRTTGFHCEVEWHSWQRDVVLMWFGDMTSAAMVLPVP